MINVDLHLPYQNHDAAIKKIDDGPFKESLADDIDLQLAKFIKTAKIAPDK